MRQPKPWFRTSKQAWYVELNGRQVRLGQHPEGAAPPKKSKSGWNAPQPILDAFYRDTHSSLAISGGVMYARGVSALTFDLRNALPARSSARPVWSTRPDALCGPGYSRSRPVSSPGSLPRTAAVRHPSAPRPTLADPGRTRILR